jgi:predicted transcriptional regulator
MRAKFAMSQEKRDFTELATEIVAAYVSGNKVSVAELPEIIKTVHAALQAIAGAAPGTALTQLEPAVPLKKSVMPDYIVCLEDGKKYKSLKRHLRTHHAMNPDQYRAKWSLSHDYPLVAPNYAKERSNLAKQSGLGHARKGG